MNIDGGTLFFSLALVAFGFKLYWCYASQKYKWAGVGWYFMLAALCAFNASEFLLYDLRSNNLTPNHLINAYYISALGSLVSIIGFIKRENSPVQTIILSVFVCGFLVLATLFVTGDLLIRGYVAESLPIKTIKGDYFQFCLIFIILALATILAMVSYNYRTAECYKDRCLQIYFCWAFTPLLLVSFVISLGILVGLDVNGSGLFPIATSAFLGVTIVCRCRPENEIRIDPRISIPYSPEFIQAGRLAQIVYSSNTGSTDIGEALTLIEYELFKYRVAASKGKPKTSLAKQLGVSRQTLDRRLEKYNLDI